MPVLDFRVSDVSDVLWTLTERCNLSCEYCFVIPRNAANRYEPSREEVDRILSELTTLTMLDSLILSGGESLLSPHLPYVLERSANVARMQYVITNGTTLREPQRRILERFRPRVMITLDSIDTATNAKTRGAGAQPHTLDSIDWCVASGLFTIAILVLTHHNIDAIPATVESLYSRGVRNILIQQLHCTTPRMNHAYIPMLPSVSKVTSLFSWIQTFSRDHEDLVIDDNEACFFQRRPIARVEKCDPDESYLPQRMFMCGAGYKFFAIKANGDIIPCNAFLDTPVGNIHSQRLVDILETSPVLRGLRNLRTHRVNEIPECVHCPDAPICDGGCRADVYNLTGEIGNPHPCCPKCREHYRGVPSSELGQCDTHAQS